VIPRELTLVQVVITVSNPLGLGLDHATVELSARQRSFLKGVRDPYETIEVLLDEKG
jgi:hypothetical protein